MDITYEQIIKFLVHAEKLNSDFPTKKNFMKYQKFFPNEFQERLTNKFYRYGIQVYDSEQNNISFWSSILHLLNKDFILMDKKEQITYLKTIKLQMIEYLKENYNDFYLKDKFSKHVALEYITNSAFNPLLLEIVSFVFDINIVIFDFENTELYITSKKSFSNPWKPIILLSQYKDFWEPICSEDKKIFNYNNITIKKLLNSQVGYYCDEYLCKDFNLLDNIYEIIKLEKNNDELDISISENDNSTFVTQSILSKDFTKSKLTKMKKAEIMDIINQLELDIKQKRPTKKVLIDLILNN